MKCYGFMPGCDDKARNGVSFCGPCTREKRALGQTVVNKGSPQNEAKSVALKKRKHDRSAYEQGLCDRYALQCMSQCIQCLSQYICSNMRRAERGTSQIQSRRVVDQPLLTPLALTDVLYFVYISYHAGLRLKKKKRLALDEKFMIANPHIKLAALRSPGATKSFSHTTFHNHTIVMK